MGLQEEVELLRNIPLFAKIELSKLKLLAFTSERLTYSQDEILFSQGDVGDSAYIIIDGEADIVVNTPGGQLVIATLKQNEIVGEIGRAPVQLGRHRGHEGRDESPEDEAPPA